MSEEGLGTTSFLQLTAGVLAARRIHLQKHVQVGPFASLQARRSHVERWADSNVQDNVAAPPSNYRRNRALWRVCLGVRIGVESGEQVVHGSAWLSLGPEIEVPNGSSGVAEDSGLLVLLSKNVKTQRQADDPAWWKVRSITTRARWRRWRPHRLQLTKSLATGPFPHHPTRSPGPKMSREASSAASRTCCLGRRAAVTDTPPPTAPPRPS